MKYYLSAIVIAIAIISSALELVVQRHEARELFVRSQDLQNETVVLGREWGQLLLEQATWGTPGRIEEVAREKLNMLPPERERVVRIGAF